MKTLLQEKINHYNDEKERIELNNQIFVLKAKMKLVEFALDVLPHFIGARFEFDKGESLVLDTYNLKDLLSKTLELTKEDKRGNNKIFLLPFKLRNDDKATLCYFRICYGCKYANGELSDMGEKPYLALASDSTPITDINKFITEIAKQLT